MDKGVRRVKVLWIEFENMKTGLKIERVNFNKDVTLLVGLSGVGKTQILYAVEYSLKLAIDKDVILNPYRVGMGIQIDDNVYEWSYEIGKVSEGELILEEENRFGFVTEKLTQNGKLIFDRKEDQIFISGYDRVPQPKKDESLILQYSEDKKFEALIWGIRKLYSVEIELAVRGGIRSESFSLLKSKVIDTLEKEKNVDFKAFSHLPAAA